MRVNPPLRKNPPILDGTLVNSSNVSSLPLFIFFYLDLTDTFYPSNCPPWTLISLSGPLFLATKRALTHNINKIKKNQGFFMKLVLQSQTGALT